MSEKEKSGLMKDIEHQSLQYYIKEATKQNQDYFSKKARYLLAKAQANKNDIVSQASANLLFKNLNISKEEILAKYPDFKLKDECEAQN